MKVENLIIIFKLLEICQLNKKIGFINAESLEFKRSKIIFKK